jgi:hypothetical protein
MATLIIIPCGKTKVWDKSPNTSPTEAKDVYTGLPFQLSRWYAEKNASYWLILSAKYGLIRPDFLIPENYNVSFNDPETEPVTWEYVMDQVAGMDLDRFETVIGLGGGKYREILSQAFGNRTVEFPFAGLPIGKMNQAIKKSVEEDLAPPISLDEMPTVLTSIEVGVSYPRPGGDIDKVPTHFMPRWKFEEFLREANAHPQIRSVEDRSMEIHGMVYATFDWDPNLGMDVSAFKVWAQAELQKIVAKYLVPLYQEKWHD